MFNNIREKNNFSTLITFNLLLCCLGVTIGCMVFTNLQYIFDPMQNAEMSLLHQFSFIFYHGFDEVSAFAHLAIDIYLFIAIGMIVEKVAGSLRYLFILLGSILIYGIAISTLEIYGPSATGLIWCLSPIVVFILLEGRRIKTRSMFEEAYNFLKINLIIIGTVLPIFSIFLQFYISRDDISSLDAVINGLTPFIVCLITGFLMLILNKKYIKRRLKSINKRKKIEFAQGRSFAVWLSLIFPFYILLILYVHKYI